MTVENCPQCSSKLSPPLKSSGHQICSSCGWTDKKRIQNEQIFQSGNRKNTVNPIKGNGCKKPNELTSRELIEIAKNQKNILWLILIGFVLPLISHYLIFGSSIIQAFFVYNLAASMKSKSPAIYCILMFIPLINFIALLVLNGGATSILKKNGISVGLMGANTYDILKLQQEIQIDSTIVDLNQSSSSTSLENLEKLAELRDKSIITEEEFQEKKRRILGL
jgi:uncharacterized membrane protein